MRYQLLLLCLPVTGNHVLVLVLLVKSYDILLQTTGVISKVLGQYLLSFILLLLIFILVLIIIIHPGLGSMIYISDDSC